MLKNVYCLATQLQSTACSPIRPQSSDRDPEWPCNSLQPHSNVAHSWGPYPNREPGWWPCPKVEHSQQPSWEWSPGCSPLPNFSHSLWSHLNAEHSWRHHRLGAQSEVLPDQEQLWSTAYSPVQSWNTATTLLRNIACNPTRLEVITEPS